MFNFLIFFLSKDYSDHFDKYRAQAIIFVKKSKMTTIGFSPLPEIHIDDQILIEKKNVSILAKVIICQNSETAAKFKP